MAFGSEDKSWLAALPASVRREFLRGAGPDVLFARTPAPLRDHRLHDEDVRRESAVT